jgi:hypothetical protein
MICIPSLLDEVQNISGYQFHRGLGFQVETILTFDCELENAGSEIIDRVSRVKKSDEGPKGT